MLKIALRTGITHEEYYEMTPQEILERIEAYKENRKEAEKMIDIQAWYFGAYVAKAINATFGGRNAKYPSAPFSEKAEREEKQRKLDENPEYVFLKLKIMQANKRLEQSTKKQ